MMIWNDDLNPSLDYLIFHEDCVEFEIRETLHVVIKQS